MVGGKVYMGFSLIAFDTDHIKSYVFGTDRLKEIRGASALLDELNRKEMLRIAKEFCGKDKMRDIYLNGGSGLFLLMAGKEEAHEFGKLVRKRFEEATRGGASVTYVVYELPERLPGDSEPLPNNMDALMEKDLRSQFDVLHYCLREAKSNPPDLQTITLPSHPFFRACDSCGRNYAEHKVAGYGDPDDSENADDTGHYCAVCYGKQKQNNEDKIKLRKFVWTSGSDLCKNIHRKSLWQRILCYLKREGYTFSDKVPERPKDFNVFRNFLEGKEYIGLIYADANNMGVRLGDLRTLREQQEFAEEVDEAIHIAVSRAIKKHLPLSASAKGKNNQKLFPFDILLLGGDDLVMVTDAAKAMDIASTIAKEFYQLTEASKVIHPPNSDKDLANDPACTLSIGVVLAPIKYPFRLLLEMGEDALKAAKNGSLKIRERAKAEPQANEEGRIPVDDSCIDFIVVTGGSIKKFAEAENQVYKRKDKDKKQYFYATLRPYDRQSLDRLLVAIREGHQRNLGRTKLHALREAVLEKNLTTSVSHGLAVLRNWREEQRKFALALLYEFERRSRQKTDLKQPEELFPRITFPWFFDPEESKSKEAKYEVYRTAFLDFVELYDFVTREDGNGRDEN
jgi:hypothetical protein